MTIEEMEKTVQECINVARENYKKLDMDWEKELEKIKPTPEEIKEAADRISNRLDEEEVEL